MAQDMKGAFLDNNAVDLFLQSASLLYSLSAGASCSFLKLHWEKTLSIFKPQSILKESITKQLFSLSAGASSCFLKLDRAALCQVPLVVSPLLPLRRCLLLFLETSLRLSVRCLLLFLLL